MNLFPIAAQDLSYVFLTQIFGQVGNVLQPLGGASFILGQMFKTLNASILVLGAIFITYTTVVGLLKTASEGEFLGKNWNSLWVPIRSVVGITALFPTASGYSVLQIIFMWVILQGVGAADALWTTVLSVVSYNGSPTSLNPTVPLTLQQNMESLFQALTCEATASATYPDRRTSADGGSNPYLYYCADNKDSNFCRNPPGRLFCTDPNNAKDLRCSGVNYIEYIGPEDGTCGKMQYCNAELLCSPISPNNGPSSLACQVCKAQTESLQTIFTAFRGKDGLAGRLTSVDHDYLQFYMQNNPTPPAPPEWIQNYCSKKLNIPLSQCCIYSVSSSEPAQPSSCLPRGSSFFKSPFDDSMGGDSFENSSQAVINDLYIPYGLQDVLQGEKNFIADAMNTYTQAVNGAVSNWLSEQGPPTIPGFPKALSTGWLLAGGYYYTIANYNNDVLNAGQPFFAVAGNNPELARASSEMSGYRNNYSTATYLTAYIDQQSGQNNGFGSSLPPQFSGVGEAFSQGASEINGMLKDLFWGQGLSDSGDMLSRLQSFGETLITTGMSMFLAFLGITTILTSISAVDPLVLGTGLAYPLVYAGVTNLVKLILPLLTAYVVLCFVAGGLLAIYLPLIPYIVFTMGSIGWFIGVIEAMAAAPIVALGILSPGGQNEILGRSEHGFMILLNIFLRPTLMILGLITGMILANVVLELIVMSFGQTGLMARAGNAGVGSLVESLILLIAFALLVITAVSKCFSLIYHIPERVLTWIGAQPVSYGEGEALQAVRGGMQSASDQLGRLGVGMASSLTPNYQRPKRQHKDETTGPTVGTQPEAKDEDKPK